MYRQPENNNRVKYMKNRFEKLDSEKNNCTDIKNTKINNKTNDKNINNNDYKNRTSYQKNSIHDDITKSENEEIFDIKVNPGLTRQLSDPSKKGCIKRTPAFRKEKFANSRIKSNDISFEGKVSLFEDNHDKGCDKIINYPDLTNSENIVQRKKLTSSVSLVLNKPPNVVQSSRRTSLNPKEMAKNANKSSLYNIQSRNESYHANKRLSDSSVNSSGSEFGSPPKNNSFLSVFQKELGNKNVNNNCSDLRHKEIYQHDNVNSFKQTTSPDLNMTVKQVLVSPKLQRSPHVSPKFPVKTRAKTSEEMRNTFASTRATSISFLKEMIENQTNTVFENKQDKPNQTNTVLENKPIPQYAEVDKSKKKVYPENLTDTLKAALKQPLPSGPPPKKPPRTFAHTSKDNTENKPKIINDTIANLNMSIDKQETPKKVKSDPKIMLQKLENALRENKLRTPKLPKKIQSSLDHCKPKSSSPTNPYQAEPNIYTAAQKTILANCLSSFNCAASRQSYSQCPTLDSKSTFFVDKNEEPIYAEPFEYQVVDNESPKESFSRLSTISRSVHYMSSPVSVSHVDRSPSQSQGDPSVPETSEKLNKHKLNLIMNHTYASLTHSDSDEIDSSTSTPTSETPTSIVRPNTIRDLIASYEEKLKATEGKMPGEILYPLSKQKSDSSLSEKKIYNGLTKQLSAEDSVSDKCFENDYYSVERKRVKAELSRTLTEIRKNYVRRVCSTVRKKDKGVDDSPHLFECCLLVELNTLSLTPFVKGKYPVNYKTPPWIEHLCYPDASDWTAENMGNSSNQNLACQCFSLVLTNEKGDRKFGYCRRVLPEEASVCLPLTYCIISQFRAPGFYHKVLQELESRHGLPHWLQNAFLRELYNSKFPQPCQSVKISCLLQVIMNKNEKQKSDSIKKGDNKHHNGHLNKKCDIINEDDGVICERNTFADNDREIENKIHQILNKLRQNKIEFEKINNYVKELKEKSFKVYNEDNKIVKSSDTVLNSISNTNDSMDINKCMEILNLPHNELVQDCLLGDVEFRRPFDHRIEDTDLTVLFETLKIDVLLQILSSLLLERKVVLVGKCLSRLSSCVEAMQSILYPFNWQHTFIPVLSSNMLTILSAPLPLVAGVLANHIKEELIIEDGIAVNLDTSKVICSMGDEPRILPKRFRNGLSIALQLVTSANSVDGSRNLLVSEAFMRLFVEVCGHYKQFINSNEKGEKVFDRDGFIKFQTSKSVQMFLDWFTETAMFHIFIQSQIDSSADDNIFEQRCMELQNEKHKHRGMNLKKMKSFFKS